MQFLMLMIPKIYRGNKVDPGFRPDPKKLAEMGRFNEELGKAVTILSLNGLQPLNTGARVSFGKGKPIAGNANGVVNSIIGGWEVSGIAVATTGRPARRPSATSGETFLT